MFIYDKNQFKIVKLKLYSNYHICNCKQITFKYNAKEKEKWINVYVIM